MFGSFLVGVVLFCVTAAVLLHVINGLLKTTEEMDTISRKVQLAGDLRLRIHQLLTPINNYLITGNPQERDNFDRSLTDISQILIELKRFQGDGRWQTVARQVADGAVNLGGKAVAILYIDDPVGNRKAAKLMEEINQVSQDLISSVEEFHHITKEDVSRKNSAAAAKVNRVKTLFVVIILVAFLSLAVLAIYLSVSVTRPIRELHKGAGIIADGNLSHRLQVSSKDEIGDLAQEFNRMTESLGMARESLDKKIKELFTLYQVSSVLSSGFETVALLNHLVVELSQQLGIDRILVFLIDETGERLYTGASTDMLLQQREQVRLKVGEGIFGRVAFSGETMKLDDIHTSVNEDYGLLPEEKAFFEGAQSGVLIPFGTRGKISGVMAAFTAKPGGFEVSQTELLTSVAEHMAIAIENARLYEEAKYLSVTDGLTGLHNHRFFKDRFAEEVRRAGRYRRPLSLVMMDVDYFKHFNDTHGHPSGDLILRMVANQILHEV